MATPNDVWQCPACTLCNSMSLPECSACEGPRPAVCQASAPRSATPAVVTSAAQVPAVPTAGLSLQDRKALSDEMALKRQKKEEEKRRILEDAEADRRQRAEMSATFPRPAAAPVTTRAAVRASVDPAAPVKLQLRCPQWSRTINFSCFTGETRILDVQSALYEELLRGEGGGGSSSSCRVPPKDSIVLVETVPPRRRFVAAEDLNMSLLEAGLCPSVALLVEATPVEVIEPLLCPAPSSTTQPMEQDRASDAQADSSGSGSDDDSRSAGGDSGFRATPLPLLPPGGRGPLPRPGRPGRGPVEDNRPPLFVGAGQTLGSAADDPDDLVEAASRRGGQALVAAGGVVNEKETAAAAREARLAALERRGVGVGIASGSAPAKLTPAAAAAANAVAAGQMVPSLLSQEADRVKGQLGGGKSKAERAKEREAILQRLQEDRETYFDRNIAAPDPVVSSVHSVTASLAGMVRLQIRSSSSGRAVTTTVFTASSVLREVMDFAKREFGIPDEAPSELSLAFPPRTAFISEEHLNQTLHQLGLCPSSSLIIKQDVSSACGATDVAAEPPPIDVVAPCSQANVDNVAVATVCCPRGHSMSETLLEEASWCDKCQAEQAPGSALFQCVPCDFFLCKGCG